MSGVRLLAACFVICTPVPSSLLCVPLYSQVLAQPNSSLVWIQYMAYQLSLTEVDAARSVAERALKAVSFRDEQEKLNLWVAYLNLEHTYGDATSLGALFARALQHNAPKKVYLHMVRGTRAGFSVAGVTVVVTCPLRVLPS